MLRAAALAALAALPLAAAATPKVTFRAPGGHWRAAPIAAGGTVFRYGKQATIVLDPAEPAPRGAEAFQKELSSQPATRFIDTGEVQRFVSADGRAIVALDGKLAPEKLRAWRCWVFDHGERVRVQLSGAPGGFNSARKPFLALVASIHIAAEPAPAGASPTGSAARVDETLRFTVPPRWTRTDKPDAVWLAAPAGPRGITYVMLTPAEPLGQSDLGAWLHHRLESVRGMDVLYRSPTQPEPRPGADEALSLQQELRVGGQVHFQRVVAERIGGSAVLVALDGPSEQSLRFHRAGLEKVLASLAVKSEAPRPAEPATTPVGAFPAIATPDWQLSRDDGPWRTYDLRGGAANMLVSRAAAGTANAPSDLNAIRRSMGFPTALVPERFRRPNGEWLRVIDAPAGGRAATETVLLRSGQEQMYFVLRTRALADATTREKFERVILQTHL